MDDDPKKRINHTRVEEVKASVEFRFSAPAGRLSTLVDPDGISTLFDYDLLNETTRRALDLNRNDVIDPDLDEVRIERSGPAVDGAGSGVIAPLASRSNSMNTLFQISTYRSQPQSMPRQAGSGQGRWSPRW